MNDSFETRIETKIKNLTFMVLLGFIVVILLIIGLYFKGGDTVNNTTPGGSTQDSTTSEYDKAVGKMKMVTGTEAAKLFDDKEAHILFIGRSGCGVCVRLAPELATVQEDLDITINYLPLGEKFRTDFQDLFGHLTVETSFTSNGQKYEGTYGELLNEGGFTPMIIVIKDGKMVDGFVGYRDAATMKTFFNKYIN